MIIKKLKILILKCIAFPIIQCMKIRFIRNSLVRLYKFITYQLTIDTSDKESVGVVAAVETQDESVGVGAAVETQDEGVEVMTAVETQDGSVEVMTAVETQNESVEVMTAVEKHNKNIETFYKEETCQHFSYTLSHIIPNKLTRFDLNSDSIIVDVGGYKGDSASVLFSYCACKIYVFEPVKQFVEILQHRFKMNPLIEIIPAGLGGATRKINIHISDDASSSHKEFANESNKETRVVEEEVAQIIDVSEWMNQKALYKIDLIQINCEGGEYELLDRLIETGLVVNCTLILVQFHNIDENSFTHMNTIKKKIEKTHQIEFQHEFIWDLYSLRDSLASK